MKIRLVQYLLAFLAVTVVIATIYSLPVDVAARLIVALLMLAHLAIITALWGLRVGVVGAMVAFLIFNYFFVQPYFDFSIQRLPDLGIFLVFLLATIFVSYLAASTRFVPPSDYEAELIAIIVRNLPRVSSQELAVIRPNREWKILSPIIESVLRRMQKVGVKQTLETDISRGLPLVFVDSSQLEYVLTGLISNTAKYAARDTAVYIRAWLEGEFVHVQVSSQSSHLSAEEVEVILDQFTPAGSINRNSDSGTELAICGDVIRAHGGLIWAEHRSGELAFHFTLPLRGKGE